MGALQSTLSRIDGKGYKAYRDILGRYAFEDFTLIIDHVQGDPYAAPSRLRAVMPWARAALPEDARGGDRARAARDWLARGFRRAVRDERALAIDAGAQTVLDRTACLFTDEGVELRFTLNLPARGRTILGRQAEALLCKAVPAAVAQALAPEHRDEAALARHCDVVEDQVALRGQLAERDLVAFVGDGAVLPRRSGVDDRPLADAIAFAAPEALAVTLEAPNAGAVTGLGIPRGITLIVGGGFHGKSTLLRAMELGVYDHIPGDGREQVVTDPMAVKIRAEDGRAVHHVDLSPFINHLPYGKSTEAFETELASGSTSQAAALQEALELGAASLLVDEDTSATNFMIRDERMQALVAKRDEPITPFVDRIRELRDALGVSTVLVMGGSGDYFAHADTVIQMHDYLPRDVTDEAHRIAAEHADGRREEGEAPLAAPRPRALRPKSVDPADPKGKVKTKVRGVDTLVYGRDDVDLRAVEQLVDPSQVRGIARVLQRLASERGEWIEAPAERVAQWLAADWERLAGHPDGDLARPRLAEVMAALNRLRSARFRAL
ncbi:ABC-ATPase domain-containing protein [Arhodomonas sp. SL1]|uniref:ABC-ATPase domain-containing protein n=1 Tax=Arhodomonas sp. SL1 TaxID=3425691 RepID=UPI003F8816CD